MIYSFFFDFLLHMEIILRRCDVSMTAEILNGLHVHTERLHLRYVGVTAAMGRQETDTADRFERLLEVLAEYTRIANRRGLPMPDEGLGGLAEFDGVCSFAGHRG